MTDTRHTNYHATNDHNRSFSQRPNQGSGLGTALIVIAAISLLFLAFTMFTGSATRDTGVAPSVVEGTEPAPGAPAPLAPAD